MGNPNVPQGNLNRLKASVVWSTAPELNVTPAFLGKEMLSLAFDDPATTYVKTATGAIPSPEPYQQVTVRMHLLKTQNLSSAYKARLEANSLLGDGIVYVDVPTGQGLTPYALSDCAIANVNEIAINGLDAGWVVTVTGFYTINNNLWN